MLKCDKYVIGLLSKAVVFAEVNGTFERPILNIYVSSELQLQ